MQLDSISFLIFLSAVFVTFYAVPKRFQYIILLVASWIFYFLLSPTGTIALATIILITYFGAKIIEKKHNRIIFLISLGLCLIILLFYKFAVTLAGSASIVVPIGISFYTLQAIGYLIDVYWGKVENENNLLIYALYVSFFPTILSGPIERSDNLLKQIRKGTDFSYEGVKEGILLMLLGYFEKILIADRISSMVDTAFLCYDELTGAAVAFGVVLYAIQIYADFAGYSYIVIGISKVLGFQLLENFRRPYFAINIKDFWRRWHISLSAWLRDYVYIPLGGSRCGKVRTYMNLVATFIVSGVWHGVGFHYVIWGLIHGLYQVVSSLTEKFRREIQDFFRVKKESLRMRPFKVLMTFFWVDFAWLFFRASSVSEAYKIIKCIAGNFDLRYTISEETYLLGMSKERFVILLFELVIMLLIDILHEKGGSIRRWLNKRPVVLRWGVYMVILLVLLTGAIYNYGIDASTFIYAQF